jgi:transcriptional regulator CtsR
MNKGTGVLAAFMTFAALVALGIVGYVFIVIVKPDRSDQYFTVLIQLLGTATLAAGTFWGLGKQNQKMELIKRQTNGTLSSVLEDNARLHEEAKHNEIENKLLREMLGKQGETNG